jgi:hypothetical protein
MKENILFIHSPMPDKGICALSVLGNFYADTFTASKKYNVLAFTALSSEEVINLYEKIFISEIRRLDVSVLAENHKEENQKFENSEKTKAGVNEIEEVVSLFAKGELKGSLQSIFRKRFEPFIILGYFFF